MKGGLKLKVTSNNPFNNDFGNSLRDSILEKQIKELRKRIEQLEIDASIVEQIIDQVNEIERTLHSHIEDTDIHFTVSVQQEDDENMLVFANPIPPNHNEQEGG